MSCKNHRLSVYECLHVPNHFVLSQPCICPHAAKADFAAVALRPRHSPYPMLPVEEAVKIVLTSVVVMPTTTTDSLQGDGWLLIS